MKEINEAGLDLIRSFEGIRLKAYQDSVGVWTIGYGHTKGVTAGQTCTLDQALEWLRRDLGDAQMQVDALCGPAINNNQFSALVSLAFNIGAGNVARSTLLRLVNAGKFEEAARQFQRWANAGGSHSNGLQRRREAEAKLFLTPDGAH